MNNIQKKKRQKIEKHVIKFMNTVDKSGLNGKKYKKFFAGMSDNQFLTWIRKFVKNEDMNFYMEIVPFKNEPVLQDIKDGAEYLKVPLDEYIYYQHDDNKGNPIRSPHPVPVGYLQIKRMRVKRYSNKSEKMKMNELQVA